MSYIKNIVVIAVALLFAVMASVDFIAMHKAEPIADNPNVTEIKMLSEYCPGLKGTALDTEIYVFDSGKPGGAMLILGGTHPNETASPVAAIAMAGFTHTSPLDGMQDFFDIELADGSKRTFRVGNRLTNPVDQWPDYTYFMGSSGRELMGTEIAEIRNVDRLYYGNPNGVLTERVCAGIFNLINEEDINLTMDMHEGSPEFLYLDCTMVNMKADNQKAMSIAQSMALDMQFDDLDMRAEYSGVKSYGLSHRSLGDNTASMMTLMETYNPSMGPLHGKMDDDLIINGNEPNYYQAHLDGYIYFDVPKDGYPLVERVARHVTCVTYLARAFSEAYPDKVIAFEGLGSYSDMVGSGLGKILKAVD